MKNTGLALSLSLGHWMFVHNPVVGVSERPERKIGFQVVQEWMSDMRH
jgi:hypothetical protein